MARARANPALDPSWVASPKLARGLKYLLQGLDTTTLETT